MITLEELKAWREIEEKATEGPWTKRALTEILRRANLHLDAPFAEDLNQKDAEFIAHARNTYRRLLNEVERLNRELKWLRIDSINFMARTREGWDLLHPNNYDSKHAAWKALKELGERCERLAREYKCE